MGTRRLHITPEIFLNLSRGTFRVVSNGVPEDASILDCGYSFHTAAFWVDVESVFYDEDPHYHKFVNHEETPVIVRLADSPECTNCGQTLTCGTCS